MKKIYVTPLCKTVLVQMANNLLIESRWGVDRNQVKIIRYPDEDDGSGIKFNSREIIWGSPWDDDSDLSE